MTAQASPLHATYSIMEELANIADDMKDALSAHNFNLVDDLSERNTELRGKLVESKVRLGSYVPSNRDDLEAIRGLRDFTEKVAEGDRLFTMWKQDLATYRLFGMKEVRNALKNMKYLRRVPRVRSLQGAFKGRPAIIVAAGPSRDKQFPLLAEARDRAVILTLNRCVDAFIDQGIAPDITMVTDSQSAIPRLHLTRSNAETTPTVISRVSTDLGVYDYDVRSRFCYTDGHPHETGVMQLLGLPGFDQLPGQSVAHSTVLLAYHMGCSPIILVGQDLAFTDDRYYAPSDRDDIRVVAEGDGLGRTTISERELEAGIDRGTGTLLIEVPGYYGGTVTTNPSMAKMIVYFGCIQDELDEDVHLINATEGGAYLEGMEHIPLQEALEKYCKESFDSQAIIGGIHDAVPEYKTAAETLDILHGVERRVMRVQKLAKACLKLLPMARQSRKKLRRLKELFAQLNRAQVPVDGLFLTASILEKMDGHMEGRQFNDEIGELGHSFRATAGAAEDLLPFVREAIEAFGADEG